MNIANLGALRAIEERVTGKKLKVPASVHHPATTPFSQHALPHGPGIHQPKVPNKKKKIVRQVVKHRPSATVPPFGPATIPPISQQTSSARRPQRPEDRLLDLIRYQNKRFGG